MNRFLKFAKNLLLIAIILLVMSSTNRFVKALPFASQSESTSFQPIRDQAYFKFFQSNFVEAYTDYAFQYGIMLQTYELLKDRNSRFCDWENKQTSKFVFKDRIIQPIQRLPRYGLFIKDLLKHTPGNYSKWPWWRYSVNRRALQCPQGGAIVSIWWHYFE